MILLDFIVHRNPGGGSRSRGLLSSVAAVMPDEEVDEDAILSEEINHLYGTDGLPGSRKLQTCHLDGLGSSGVYGEITTPETLFRALSLCTTDRFIDLGSGRGQLVLAAAARTAGPCPSSSCGVELIDMRHEVAAQARARAPVDVQARCELRCGDALSEDLSFVTKAFVCNTTFSGDLNESFARRLAPALAPKLELVATMMPFVDAHAAEASLVLNRVTAVKATYAPNGTALYVYARRDPDARHGAARAEGAVSGAVPVSSVVDRDAVGAMLAARREADRMAFLNPEADPGEAERGALRTALLQASLM